MKIIREASKAELLTALMLGSGTTWIRMSDSQAEYVCKACGNTFFSDGFIFYGLCDDDFGPFNVALIANRIKGNYRYSVEDWIREMGEVAVGRVEDA